MGAEEDCVSSTDFFGRWFRGEGSAEVFDGRRFLGSAFFLSACGMGRPAGVFSVVATRLFGRLAEAENLGAVESNSALFSLSEYDFLLAPSSGGGREVIRVLRENEYPDAMASLLMLKGSLSEYPPT